jgi:hypothetical protein
MNDQPITGAIALEPVRGAVATLEHVLALPDFANDTIVIVGDLDDYRRKRDAYRQIFTVLGRARRGVVWVPALVDRALERDVCRTYELAQAWPASQLTFAPRVPAPGLGAPANAVLEELIRTFKPRLAPRAARPAVYLVREHERPQWLEL